MEDSASQLRKDLVWNTTSSIVGSVAMVLMPMVVSRSSGLGAAGVFIFATAIGQQFQMLGDYSVRPYQVTDVRCVFQFGVYLSTRILTVSLMVVAIIISVFLSAKPSQGILVVILVAMLRVFDAAEDVFYGEFQRIGRLDIAGKVNSLRVLITFGTFTVVIYLTNSLLVSAAVTVVTSAVAMACLVILPAQRAFSIVPVFDWPPIAKLLLACSPLFLASFLSMYLGNAPRFAVDHYMDSDSLARYGFIFMPALAINVLAMFIFRPLQTRMAHRWLANDRKGVFHLLGRGVQAVAVASAVTLVISYLIGIPFLEWLYRANLEGLRGALMVLALGGTLNAIVVVLYYLLTTMRAQRVVLVGYALSSGVVWIATTLLVPGMGINGAAFAYTGAMAVLAALFTGFVFLKMRVSHGAQKI